MALLDTIKKAFRGKGQQVEGTIDKAAHVIDDKTGGQHRDKIDGVADKAKDLVEKLDDET